MAMIQVNRPTKRPFWDAATGVDSLAARIPLPDHSDQIMKKMSSFRETCRKHLLPLGLKFGFGNEKTESYSWGEKYSIKNLTTGISLLLEFHEHNVLARVYKLVDDQFVEPVGEITPRTELFSFDLEDIVSLRAPLEPAPRNPDQARDIEALVRRHASNLQNYARDILVGDFSLFPQLDEIVKRRAREAAFRKWGDAAVHFGWQK